jgi:hypothetical protein
MSVFNSREQLAYSIPDDLTLAQFILDVHHPARPIRPHGAPWLIQDETGQKTGFDEARRPSLAAPSSETATNLYGARFAQRSSA